MGKLQVLRQSSPTQLMCYVEVVLLLGVARFALLFISFQRLLRLFGLRAEKRQWQPETVSGPRAAEIRVVARAIRRCARHVPWQAKCLVQALTGRAMLARRGLTPCIWFGVLKEPDQAMEAHAWLVCDQQFVTGGEESGRFVPMTCFVPRDAR
ncbi:lasso peptide biosynthesis B2 protein [Acanthopleuribacter pedis]|uniref:Lasso peptide biosynthesis B2 protein n=1 Tax=Acanthopleuribacter pedis TaxID=442870 RepID=A0A8J7Q5B3_9BACT|nr:lasso peptide biosynthesis B2 protein [Acanthopleuribacter pedis]MBO1318196.1 lasso peptide biosynthesis B2 protein [Acanthopleuribacter pedis]